jgi:hypothetical protein
MPDAYLIDGGSAVPISRIVEAAEAQTPFGRSRRFLNNLARIDELAATGARRHTRPGCRAQSGQLKMRTENPRLPLRSFDGPDMAKEAVKDESERALFATAETAVPPAVEKHPGKALG